LPNRTYRTGIKARDAFDVQRPAAAPVSQLRNPGGVAAQTETLIMQVQGANVFITGANRGLGLAFARVARDAGAAKVYAGMRKVDGFAEAGLIPVQIDVTKPNQIAKAAELAGDVSLLVNNAGIAALTTDALDPTVEEKARDVLDVNFYGIIRTVQSFAPVLAKHAQSAIINVLSDTVWLPKSFLVPYCLSKSAAWAYTNHARLALAAQNTAVLGMLSGYIDTDLTAGLEIEKLNPNDVAAGTYDSLAAGFNEHYADLGTQRLKDSLAQVKSGYINPELL
jgi:NAD(P)-dependent dehydrogenase (short-subunit alcohol dehydrogenase family)